MGLPIHVAEDIAAHLDKIARHFSNPKITLVVRAPQLDDGDLVMTADDPVEAIAAVERLILRQPCVKCGGQIERGPWGVFDCPACNPPPGRDGG